jgi:hypothetical protein
MKKLIILVGISWGISTQAGTIVRAPMLDYLPTENYAMFEIKSNMINFQKIILDCQGFNMGVYFYNKDKVQNQFHMDEQDCEGFHQFLTDSKNQHQSICLEIDANSKVLEVTDKKLEDCK